MALWQRRPEEVVHHSDQGLSVHLDCVWQTVSGDECSSSMGSVGDCYDNALAESFFATLECELIDRCVWRTQADARMAICEFIEVGTTHTVVIHGWDTTVRWTTNVGPRNSKHQCNDRERTISGVPEVWVASRSSLLGQPRWSLFDQSSTMRCQPAPAPISLTEYRSKRQQTKLPNRSTKLSTKPGRSDFLHSPHRVVESST